jgi:hypothetical protein
MKHLSILSLSVACIFFAGVGLKQCVTCNNPVQETKVKVKNVNTEMVTMQVEQTTAHFVGEVVQQAINAIIK